MKKYFIFIIISMYVGLLGTAENLGYSSGTQLFFHENGNIRCVISYGVNDKGEINYVSILQIDKNGKEKTHHEIEPLDKHIVRRLYNKHNSVDDAKNKGVVNPVMDTLSFKSLRIETPLLGDDEFTYWISDRISNRAQQSDAPEPATNAVPASPPSIPLSR